MVEKLFEKYNSLLLLDALYRIVLLNKAVKTAYKTKDSLTRIPVACYQNAAESLIFPNLKKGLEARPYVLL